MSAPIPEDLRGEYERAFETNVNTSLLIRDLIERIAVLESQVQTLQKALTGRLPIDELTEVARAALAATEQEKAAL